MKQLTFVLAACLLSLSAFTQAIIPDFKAAVTRPAVIFAIGEQADGRIVVGGTVSRANDALRYNMARLNADGSTDPSFEVSFRDTAVTTLAIQSDQKILVGGYARIDNEDVGVVFRLLPNGDFDPAFPGLSFENRVQDLIILDNGTIVVGGLFKEVNNQTTDGLVRIGSDGSIDRLFDLNTGSGTQFIYGLLADGNRFYAGGNIGSDAQLYRFNSDGSLDNSFSIDEKVGFTDFMTSIRQLAFTSGGDIVFTTYTWEFDPQAVLIEPSGNRIFRRSIPNPQGLTVTKDDKILVSGELGGKPDVYWVRGSIVTPFINGLEADDQVYRLFTLDNGNVLIGGRYGQYKGLVREGLAMASQNGVISANFSPKLQRTGLIRTVIPTGQKYLIGGDFNRVNGFNAINLARLNPDGSLDPTFNQTSIPSNKPVNGMTVQQDGKILVATSASSLDVVPHDPIQRLNTNGSRDLTFRIASSIDLLGNFIGFRELPGGDILAFGSFSIIPENGFYRHLGVFSSTGTLIPDLPSIISASNISDVYVNNGQIMLAGRNISVNGSPAQSVVYIDQNGDPVNGFTNNLPTNANLRRIFPQPNGDFILSGQIPEGNDYRDLVRIRPDGSVVSDFQWPTLNTDRSPSTFPRALQALPNGDLLVSNSELSPELKMLLAGPDGQLKDSVAIGASPFITHIEAENDSTFLVAGSYSLAFDRMSIGKFNLFSQATEPPPTDTTGSGGGPDPMEGLALRVGSGAVQGNQNICLPVTAENFEDIIGLQFNVQYNPDSLQFVEVRNFNLPELSVNDFGLPGFSNNPEGLIRLAWVEPLLNPVSLDDNTVLFELCFSANNTPGNARVNIEEAEAVDFDERILAPATQSGVVTISLNPNEPTDTATLRLNITSGMVEEGESICLSVQAEEFENIVGIQLEINYDPNDLIYESVGNFNLNGLSLNNFGEPGFGGNSPGTLLWAWTSPDLSPISLPDGSALFDICFTAGDNPGPTTVSFTNPLVIDGDDNQAEFNGSPGIVTVTEEVVQEPGTDTLRVSLGSGQVAVGEVICIPVRVQDFTSIMGMQFDINFDTTVLQYQSVQNINLKGLTMGSFGQPGSGANPNGQIKLAWFDPDVNGVTIPDGTTIFELCFLALSPASQSPLTFSNIEITDDQTEPVVFLGSTGAITVTEEGDPVGETVDFTLSIDRDTITADETSCLRIRVNDFTDIVGLQFTVNYDPAKLAFESAQNFNLSGLSSSIGEPGVGNNPPGQLKVVWFDSNVQGVSLPDGTTLFEICFTPLIENGVDSIFLSDWEVVNLDGDDVPPIIVNGSIAVGAEDENILDNDNFRLNLNRDTIDFGEEVCIPITVADFDGIRGMAFDIRFDPNLLTFSAVQNSIIPNLATSVLGPGQGGTPAGTVSVNWISNSMSGVSLPDETVIMELCFTASGVGISTLSFRNPFIIDANNDLVNLNSTPGSILVRALPSENNELMVGISSDTVRIAEEVCLDVRVENFDSILSLDLSINYDPNLLQFRSVKNFNLPALDQGSFTLPGQGTSLGRIDLSWFDTAGTGVTIDSGAVIFQVCFRAVVLDGVSTVSIGNPFVLDAGGNVVDFIGIGGIVTINTEPMVSTTNLQKTAPLFSLFPVPTRDILRIEWLGDLPNRQRTDLRILDILGRPIRQFRLADQIEEINASNWTPGVYQVQVISGQRQWVQSFIKL